VIESRGLIYSTQQFALPQYNVALFSASVGPRFTLNEISPGLSVKPYVAGAALSYPLIFSRTKMQLEVGAPRRRFSYDES
jgi:hypothetical protein